VDVADDDLRQRISSRIRPPFDGIGTLEIKIESEGKCETIRVDDQWLRKERKRIEDDYTFQINNYGRLILYTERADFDKEITRFKSIIVQYQAALREELSKRQSDFEKQIIDEFAPRWESNPPRYFARRRIERTPEKIRTELAWHAQKMLDKAITFDEPKSQGLVQKRRSRKRSRHSIYNGAEGNYGAKARGERSHRFII
jgi:hypothetical protein